MYSVEAHQRLFYALDEEAIGRIVQSVVAEDLSVVEGGILDRFESAVAEHFGGRYGVGVCNGTAAIHLALFALDLKPGDEVLLAAYGYYATALPVCMMGGVPVFCDVREDTMTLDVEDAARWITPRTRAVIAHQAWGCPADVDALRALADRHGLHLISDSSHAQGALWNGRPLGEYYDFVCASFGKGKLISGGELGAVVTNEARFRDRMLLYGHVNRVPRALFTQEYRHIQNAVGVKYRPHPFAMALALEQMSTYPERSRRLVTNARRFEGGLRELRGFRAFSSPEESERVYWGVPVRVDPTVLGDVSSVLERLLEDGCPVQKKDGVLIPWHNALTDFYGVKTQRSFPVAERLGAETFQVVAFALFDDSVLESTLESFREVTST